MWLNGRMLVGSISSNEKKIHLIDYKAIKIAAIITCKNILYVTKMIQIVFFL